MGLSACGGGVLSRVLGIVAAVLLLPAPAAPADPTEPVEPATADALVPRAVDPCAEEVRRFCPGVKPGGGRVVGCLRQHQAEIGEACRDKLQGDVERARRFVREFGEACRGDVNRYCAAIDPGGGRVLGCLAQHLPELATRCQAEIERLRAARERVAVFRRTCGADVGRVCAGVPAQAGPLVECLEANEGRLSAECRATDFRTVADAAVLVDVVEEMTSEERIRESLEILQGLDTVAFSRSQILLQLDSFQSMLGKANGGRFLLNPQFVFGERGEFALQVKVPITGLFPYAAGAPTQFGLGAVMTAFGWNFLRTGQVRHFASIGLQWATASSPPVGGPWAIVPAYAFGMGLARWLSLTTQVVWLRSIASGTRYPEMNVLYLEPILAANLPGRSFLALDTRLGWNFVTGTFIPIMKGAVGMFTDRQRTLSVSAWYQAALTEPAATQYFKYEVGMGLAYFFDW